MTKNPFLALRLSPAEFEALDRLAEKRCCSRSEAARLALTIGVPLATSGLSLDLRRIAILLEYTQAGIDVIISREHADFADSLETLAIQRVEQFHA
jgi:NADH:ubiquinone oxidoreductase subunit D